MKTIMLSALALLVPLISKARIGETREQCLERYGEPIASTHNEGELSFLKAGLIVMLEFHEGVCDRITISKYDQDSLGNPDALSDDEISVLLEANGSGKEWSEQPIFSASRVWALSDQSRFAQYSPPGNLLVILTKESRERADHARKAETAKKLDGF